MSVLNYILGRPLASSEESREKLTVLTGVPVLGLDALASTAYGPEAALNILLPAGLAGLHYFPFVVFGILFELGTLYLSYQQTAAAYPSGGGAYTVTKENLGPQYAPFAAVALLIDYLLNVAVGIAAGVGAIISAVPFLQPYTLAICLLVLLTLTMINLRGVRETGLIFIAPVFVFIGCIGVAIVLGAIHTWQAGGNPMSVVPPPPVPHTTAAVSLWLLLAAFANGCTAMTGVEAVSNGVPLFDEPTVPNAHWTLTIVIGILSLFLLGLAYICPAYHIIAMDEQNPGYQTILSQLIAAIAGHGAFYYIATASIFVVVTYSAQTSFADFPRVCRLLAEDDFLPHSFANRGRRLVFSDGIIVLAILSGAILLAFGGVTEALIPLFAVGAFGAFVFSQVGMVLHWWRRPGRGVRVKLFLNALGATTTTIALGIIIVAKFREGAWVVVVVVPALVLVLRRIKRHYEKVALEIEHPIELQARNSGHLLVIIPINGWNRVAEKAVRFGLLISDKVTVLHVATEDDEKDRLKELWKERVTGPAQEKGYTAPTLEIVQSPYRQLCQPILDFIDRVQRNGSDQLIAVIIPELVEPHWYEYLLHNFDAARLRTLLYLKGNDRTMVVNVPWHIHDE